MKTFRRLMFLGVFASVGAGLALCVSLSTKASPDDLKHRRRIEKPAAQQKLAEAPGAEAVLPPAPVPAPLAPAVTMVAVPQGYMLAQPYGPTAQQAVPDTARPGRGGVWEALQRALVGQPGPSGVNDARLAPAAASNGRPSKATVDAEGNGKLSIHIQDADLREVLDLLSEQGKLNILAGSSVAGKVSATLDNVDIDSALDAILKSTGFVAKREGDFIFVGTPAEFDTLEQSLDKIGTRVYRPNYVTAAELQALITPLMTETVGVVSVSSPAEMGIADDDAAVGGDNFACPDVVVVRDYNAVLTEIDQLVREIDIRPAQVVIEAMILSVKLGDEDKFGVSFELFRDKPNVKLGWGSPLGALKDLKFGAAGLKFGFLDSSLGVFIEALEKIGDTNVIATPRLMVLNKHRATIQIGQKKGYVSTTVTETASTQSVEFLDLGTQLRLRPFISSDGLIRMEIHPEISDGDVVTKDGFTLPNKQLTEVTTNVMVRDGCTVIIGGLMREQLATSTTQVPVLGNLPLLGFLFREKKETIERHEVLVLITPRIIYEPETCEEGDQSACEFHRRQAVYAEKMSPLGKRSIGRRYLRLAQGVWASGDRDLALYFAELAVHFDPLNRRAIDLRAEIWLGLPYGEHSLAGETVAAAPMYPLQPGTMLPVDSEMIPAWLLDDLHQEPTPQVMPLHPLDRGQPGPQTDLIRPRRLQ